MTYSFTTNHMLPCHSYFNCNFTNRAGLVAWILLPGDWSVSIGCGADEGTTIAFSVGPVDFFRPMTEEETQEEEYAAEEAAYHAWCAEAYSY